MYPNAGQVEPVSVPAATDGTSQQIPWPVELIEQALLIRLPGDHAIGVVPDGNADGLDLIQRKLAEYAWHHLIHVRRSIDCVLIAAAVVLPSKVMKQRKNLHAGSRGHR